MTTHPKPRTKSPAGATPSSPITSARSVATSEIPRHDVPCVVGLGIKENLLRSISQHLLQRMSFMHLTQDSMQKSSAVLRRAHSKFAVRVSNRMCVKSGSGPETCAAHQILEPDPVVCRQRTRVTCGHLRHHEIVAVPVHVPQLCVHAVEHALAAVSGRNGDLTHDEPTTGHHDSIPGGVG